MTLVFDNQTRIKITKEMAARSKYLQALTKSDDAEIKMLPNGQLFEQYVLPVLNGKSLVNILQLVDEKEVSNVLTMYNYLGILHPAKKLKISEVEIYMNMFNSDDLDMKEFDYFEMAMFSRCYCQSPIITGKIIGVSIKTDAPIRMTTTLSRDIEYSLEHNIFTEEGATKLVQALIYSTTNMNKVINGIKCEYKIDNFAYLAARGGEQFYPYRSAREPFAGILARYRVMLYHRFLPRDFVNKLPDAKVDYEIICENNGVTTAIIKKYDFKRSDKKTSDISNVILKYYTENWRQSFVLSFRYNNHNYVITYNTGANSQPLLPYWRPGLKYVATRSIFLPARKIILTAKEVISLTDEDAKEIQCYLDNGFELILNTSDKNSLSFHTAFKV